MPHFILYAIASVLTVLQGVRAGAGANVFVCFSIPDPAPPVRFPMPFHVSFTPGEESHCMSAHGRNADMPVTQGGLPCISIDYVEKKSSSGCWFDPTGTMKISYSYQAGNEIVTGTVKTLWYLGSVRINPFKKPAQMNIMDLEPPNGRVIACGKDCETGLSSERTYWQVGTTGPIYIVFDFR